MTEVVTNGAEAPVVPAIADDGVNGQPQGDALEQRIQSDPAFALEQYKKVKGEGTKHYQRIKDNEAILKISDQLGGAATTANILTEFAVLATDPDVARKREYYRVHGTLPPATSTRTEDTSEDEYKDPQTQKIEDLERQLSEVRNSISQTKGVIGKQSVMTMLGQLRNEYPDGFDEHILPKLETNFAEWERTPQGRELLSTLSYEQLKTVASRAITDNLDAIAEKRYQRVLEAKKRAATGPSAQTMSTGREAATGTKITSAREALAEFRRQYGENFS